MDIDSFDGRIYFRLLAAVSAADGQVHRTEIDRFCTLLELAESDPGVGPALCTEALDHRKQPLWFLPDRPLDRAFTKLCLRDALVLAASDGWSSTEEHDLIARAAIRMGHPDLLDDLPGIEPAEHTGQRANLPFGHDAQQITAEVDRGISVTSEGGEQDPAFDPSLYFRLMAAVVAADEEVLEEEVARFEQLLELIGTDPSFARPLCREAMLRREDPLWFLGEIDAVDPDFADRMLREATLLARSDGELHPTEHALLHEAARLLGRTGFSMPEPDDVAWRPESADIRAEEVRLDKVLAAASGAGIVAGGTWVLAGGAAAKVASGIAGVIAMGLGGWMVPLVLLVGAGAAGALVPVLRRLSDDND